ncbi:hypothetical protein HID58_053436 [Brassica napus]|uniref:Uncharacterized protein n=1 Tax=Brassica napus TaxID=3708 RepID=A0ABQ8AFE5_BRANA|nr:hypothetical protein HID58_053436 [Brassica napus]
MIINPPKIPPHFTISLIPSAASQPPLLITFVALNYHINAPTNDLLRCLCCLVLLLIDLVSWSRRMARVVDFFGGDLGFGRVEMKKRPEPTSLAEEEEEEEEEGWLGLERGKEEVTSLPSLSWRHNAHIPPRFFV